MSSRIYIGRLSYRATEKDVERFFRGYGRIVDIVLKNGFGFVEFYDRRDADDAVYELNGKELCGDRVVLEFSRTKPRQGGYDRYPPPRRGESRYGPPIQTRYRLIVENLSSRVSWQDLKDMMRSAGEVTYADAHKEHPNEGVICFASRDGLERAIDKFQGKEVNGRKLKLIDDSEPARDSRSRTRSRSRSKNRKRSRSDSLSRSRSRSRSGSRSSRRSSRSRSSRSRTKSRSATPEKTKSKSRSRSASSSGSRKSEVRSRSASRTPDKSPASSHNDEPMRENGHSKSPSPE